LNFETAECFSGAIAYPLKPTLLERHALKSDYIFESGT
jgi:hypothetical protein